MFYPVYSYIFYLEDLEPTRETLKRFLLGTLQTVALKLSQSIFDSYRAKKMPEMWQLGTPVHDIQVA